jgi:excisionase family DNA binding protein
MKHLLTIKEATQEFGIGKDIMYRLIHTESNFPKLKVGSFYKINAPMFQEWLNEKTRKGESL